MFPLPLAQIGLLLTKNLLDTFRYSKRLLSRITDKIISVGTLATVSVLSKQIDETSNNYHNSNTANELPKSNNIALQNLKNLILSLKISVRTIPFKIFRAQ
jgi:hypothetical protein